MKTKKKVIETFEIEEGVQLLGNRGDSEFHNQIAKSMKLLKAGGPPFFVPVGRSSPSNVSTSVSRQKKFINKSVKVKDQQEYTIRTVKDENKKVIGTRVFRIA